MKHQLPKDILNILSLVREESVRLELNYIIAGATARDIIIWYQNGLQLLRATTDIDIAIYVKDWDAYNKFKSNLVLRGFSPHDKAEQRLMFDARPLDLIPFGEIAKDNLIHWPSNDDVALNIFGFDEAYDNREIIEITDGIEVNVVSLIGLVVLKLISWNDNPPERGKDIYDLFAIFLNYDSLCLESELFEKNSDLLDLNDFDYRTAWIRILGRDISKSFSKNIVNRLSSILSRELEDVYNSQLIAGMIQVEKSVETEFKVKLLNEFHNGLNDN